MTNTSRPGSSAINRRDLFKAAGGLLVVAAAGSALAGCSTDAPRDAADGGPRPLPIPPLLEPELADGWKTFSLKAEAGQSAILAGVSTPTWGYNGTILGPTIRARRGDQVRMRVTNALPEMTTVHWHGMHLPAQMDGGPHQPIEPGTTWSPEWKIGQQAATLWYHPHPHGETELHVYRGLTGMIILDDEVSDAAGLPSQYGVDDIPLVIQDRRFNEDGTLDETDRPDLGLLGNTVNVNGIANPSFTATTNRVRFRILNGSSMRMYNLQFSDRREFHLVGSDGGLLDQPKPVTNVYLSPAERAELVVDLTAGEKVTLRAVKFPDNLEVDDSDAPNFGLSDEFDVLSISGPASASAVPALPTHLNPTLVDMPDVRGARTREFDMEWYQINGKLMDMSRIDEVIDHAGWEVWTVANKDNWLHNFHVHGTQFRVLSLTRTSTTPQIDGWKDTILLAPGAVAKIAVQFGDYTSTSWPYMYHCHMMFHEDQGMMGQFVVVKPGEKPTPEVVGVPMGSGHGGHGAN